MSAGVIVFTREFTSYPSSPTVHISSHLILLFLRIFLIQTDSDLQ
jgi:hypothetical protein